MARQITSDEFIRVVSKSGVVNDERLRESLARITQHGSNSKASTIADRLVEDHTLTRWQANYLLQGKYKNFFLGKYRLLSLIGKGGMGAVYLAEHTMLNRRCAIKILPGVFARNANSIERFMREAQVVAAMDHPNIVRAYDVDKDINDKREMYYLTMEYVEGKDVDDLVKDGLPDFVQAADIIRQAAEGLAYAHRRNLVHRDIKPANLLYTNDGVVKILDLGLARNFDDDEAASLTAAQDACYLGTPDYLAPEQAVDCHDVDGRADIYSLGCSLYFLLTGNPPFGEGTIAQRLIAHQSKEPPQICKSRPDAPQELIDITATMMEKDRDDRYQTAREVSNALAGWLLDNAGDKWIEKNPAAVSTAESDAGTVGSLEEIDDSNDFHGLESLVTSAKQSGTGTLRRSGGASGLEQHFGSLQLSGVARPKGTSVRPTTFPLRRGQKPTAKKSAIPMRVIILSIAAGAFLVIGMITLIVVLGGNSGDTASGNNDSPGRDSPSYRVVAITTEQPPAVTVTEPEKFVTRSFTSFEENTAGTFDSFETNVGTWTAKGGNAFIDDKYAAIGMQCLHLAGGDKTIVELEIADGIDTGGNLTFRAERWTIYGPFSFRIEMQTEKQTDDKWTEIYNGDGQVQIGRSFLSHVNVPLTDPKIARLRFTVTSPPKTGVLIDDLQIAPALPR